MFRKKKVIEQIVEEVMPKPKAWKTCGNCTKPQKKNDNVICGDVPQVYLVFGLTGYRHWERCDGFTPKHCCATCAKRDYCKLNHMNTVYADIKIREVYSPSSSEECEKWICDNEIQNYLSHIE